MIHPEMVGKRVRISQDCRDGSPATGAYGIYEGDFPISAIINDRGNYREVDYNQFIQWNQKREHPLPNLVDLVAQEPKYEGPIQDWKPVERDYPFWFPETNPRIKLDDGSTIWGCECWWGVIDDEDPPLEDLQKAQEKTIETLRAIAEAIKENAFD